MTTEELLNSPNLFDFLLLLKKYDVRVDMCLPDKERYEAALKELEKKMGIAN